jgi:hypothetical protein
MAGEIRYDFFLAHAGGDNALAVELRELLKAHRVFVDSEDLLPGDEWDVELPKVQRASRVSVILISSEVEKAWYAREEIAAAINLAKVERQRVVPLFLEGLKPPADVPYGLRRLVAIYLERLGSLEAVAEKLSDLLLRLDKLAEDAPRPPKWRVSSARVVAILRWGLVFIFSALIGHLLGAIENGYIAAAVTVCLFAFLYLFKAKLIEMTTSAVTFTLGKQARVAWANASTSAAASAPVAAAAPASMASGTLLVASALPIVVGALAGHHWPPWRWPPGPDPCCVVPVSDAGPILMDAPRNRTPRADTTGIPDRPDVSDRDAGCRGDEIRCNGACVSLQSSVQHCGACGHRCETRNTTPRCENGDCVIGACANGFANCDDISDNGCETNVHTDLGHCGACNAPPCTFPEHADPYCDGQCRWRCAAGWADCNGNPDDGCETDLSTPSHCGSCAVSCPIIFTHGEPVCYAGRCTNRCATSWRDCDLSANPEVCETNIDNDTEHCGDCRYRWDRINPNAESFACIRGAFQNDCRSGFGDCNGDFPDGCEADLASDANHCGRCETRCQPSHATGACNQGRCSIQSCVGGHLDCDQAYANGCEVNPQADQANCGSCGNACEGGLICSRGACVSSP